LRHHLDLPDAAGGHRPGGGLRPVRGGCGAVGVLRAALRPRDPRARAGADGRLSATCPDAATRPGTSIAATGKPRIAGLFTWAWAQATKNPARAGFLVCFAAPGWRSLGDSNPCFSLERATS